jgi:hypothetical protein
MSNVSKDIEALQAQIDTQMNLAKAKHQEAELLIEPISKEGDLSKDLAGRIEKQGQTVEQAKLQYKQEEEKLNQFKIERDNTLPEKKKQLEGDIVKNEKSIKETSQKLSEVDEKFQALDLQLAPYLDTQEQTRITTVITQKEQELERLKQKHLQVS